GPGRGRHPHDVQARVRRAAAATEGAARAALGDARQRACRRRRAGIPGVAADARAADDEALTMAKLNMVKALNLALLQEMERDEDVLILGEDVGVDGGVFRVTEDLHRKFGSKCVIDSPLAEAAII